MTTNLANNLAEPQSISTRQIVAFVVMVFGMFMAILDIQVVSASLADIQAGLGAGADEISWVQTSYLIAEVIMVPLSGMLARILSTRVLFAYSAAGFTLASALCATATNMEQMIIYRAIQGFIGGGMIPSVFAAAFTIFPKNKQAMVSAVIGLVATMAPTIGPTVGGYISHAMSWHWLFLINIVPGILVATLSWRLIDFDKPQLHLLKRFDWWGLLFMAVFLGTLEYVLEEGNAKGWLDDPHIFQLTVLMGVSALAFFIRVLRIELPIVDIRAYKNLNFAVGSIFSLVMGVGIYGLTYLYPLYLGIIRGYNSLMIGQTMFVSGMAMFFTAPVAGMLSGKFDARYILLAGFSIFGFSTYMMTDITADWDFYELMIPQILRGIGMMMCMVTVNNIALSSLPREMMNNASGLFNLTRNLGGAVGLALINSMLTQRTAEHTSRLSELTQWGSHSTTQWVNQVGQALSSNAAEGKMLALGKLAGLVKQQAWIKSFSDVFFILSFLFIAMAVAIVFVEKPNKRGGGAGH